tara:strand:- start:2535 stop:2738 length:204 start_codon:yes stop_codon:yes gene_type:complete
MTSKKTNSLKLNEAEPKTNSSNKLNANQLIDLFNSRDIIDRSTLDAMDMKRLEMMERIVGNIYRKGE